MTTLPTMLAFVLFVYLVPCLVAGATVRANTCPLANCQSHNEDGEGSSSGSDGDYHYTYSLMETSSKRSSETAKARSQKGCGQTFTPAHFSCTSCDVSSCKGCKNVVCDLAKCIGKFYSQECWCTKPLNPKVNKFFCNDDCTGGLCDTAGLKCKTRESSCKPWWWCKLPPPKEPDSFLQKATSKQKSCAPRESSKRLNERLEKARSHLHASSLLQESSESNRAVKRQIDDFSFSSGSWVCESALMPKPDEDPVTLAQYPAGFVVLDGRTCSGGFFKSKCFCYDKFKYLRGQDPMVSELSCDEGCGAGDCAGKTCGKEPPPPLPAPAPPPPLDPMVQELAAEGMLRNYGTQMSPVQ